MIELNRVKSGALAALVTTGALIGNASAQLTTSEATGAITDALAKCTTVIAAGFAIGGLFMVARLIKRAMSKAG